MTNISKNQLEKRFLIIGQGAIGKPLADKLAENPKHKVIGVARSDRKQTGRAVYLQKDARTLDINDLQGVTHIAIIVTPSSSTVPGYQDSYLAICEHLSNLAKNHQQIRQSLRQVLFLSSTSVYGENAGETIDENTQALPTKPTAQILRQTEQILSNAFGDKAIIVRASGIYGKQRLRLVRQASIAHQDGVLANQWTNRIMDTDLIAVLERILLLDSPKSLYLATDFCPATSDEVLGYIASLTHNPPPKIIDAPQAGKKIIANIPKAWLTFADYQAGYRFVVQSAVDSVN